MNKSNPWFRMYHEFATDPKVQMLSEVDQRRFIMLLCFRCCNGDVTLHETELAFQLRVSQEEWEQTKKRLMAKDLIDEDGQPIAWDKRQYASDSSTVRVRKYRENKKRQCNVTSTVTETKCNALDTDTDTDTDTDKRKPPSAKTPPKRFVKPTLDELFLEFQGKVMNPSLEAQTFFDHYETVGWVVGKNKPMKDWQAAVRQWVSRSKDFNKPDNPGSERDIVQTPEGMRERVAARLRKFADTSWASS